MTPEKLLTTSEAAQSLSVGETFVVQLIRSGALPATQRDDQWFLDAAIVAAFKHGREERRDGLRELTRMTKELGGYDHEGRR